VIWAVASRKGSPGATTLAALLAWRWPDAGEPRLIVEADPDGGVLAARWHAAAHLTHEPGLLSLAAARDGDVGERVARHVQSLAPGVDVLVSPPSPAQVIASLRALGDDAVAALARDPRPCFVDCGRLGPASAALPWARQAERVLLVMRPRLDEVVALRPVVEALDALSLPLGLVTVGERPFHPLEVADQLSLPLLGVVADDPAAAALVDRGELGARALHRSRLARSVAELARVLGASVAPEPVVPEPGVPAPVEASA
jgi:hypothetical protein